MLDSNIKIYVAGHRGLVGSAIVRNLQEKGYGNIVAQTHAELDLTDQLATEAFFAREQPEYVFLAAAKVGGILANNRYPAMFIHENLVIQSNVIHAAYKNHAKRLMFLGSGRNYLRGHTDWLASRRETSFHTAGCSSSTFQCQRF